MRFTEAVVAVAACLAQVQIAQAALAFTHWPTTIDAGAPTTLNWDSDSDAVRSLLHSLGISGALC